MNSGLKAENSDNKKGRGRQRDFSENPVGSRILAALDGRSRKWLAEESDLPESTISDYIAKGIAKTEAAIAIANALGVSLDWLLAGDAESNDPANLSYTVEKAQAVSGRLSVPKTPYGAAPADDSDWVKVAEFDLRLVNKDGRGGSIGETPFRRDWLNRAFGSDKGLWLGRLLSDYAAADLSEGDAVVLRDIAAEQLQERQLILWRVYGRLAIGRFSAALRETEPNGEYWVPPVMIGDKEEDMTPIARILGRPLAPIR